MRRARVVEHRLGPVVGTGPTKAKARDDALEKVSALLESDLTPVVITAYGETMLVFWAGGAWAHALVTESDGRVSGQTVGYETRRAAERSARLHLAQVVYEGPEGPDGVDIVHPDDVAAHRTWTQFQLDYSGWRRVGATDDEAHRLALEGRRPE